MAKVQVSSEGHVQGVVLQDGSEVRSKVVLSNASPQVTFLKLTPQVRPEGGGKMSANMGGCWSREPGLHEDGRCKCQVSALGEAISSLPNRQVANREEASWVGRKVRRNEMT